MVELSYVMSSKEGFSDQLVVLDLEGLLCCSVAGVCDIIPKQE